MIRAAIESAAAIIAIRHHGFIASVSIIHDFRNSVKGVVIIVDGEAVSVAYSCQLSVRRIIGIACEGAVTKTPRKVEASRPVPSAEKLVIF